MDKYTINKDDEHKAIVVTLHEGYRLATDYPEQELKEMFGALTEPYHFVVDFSALSPSLNDLTRTASATARGESPLLQNPNVERIFIITHSDLVRMAAKGLSSPVFGHVNITACASLDEVYDMI